MPGTRNQQPNRRVRVGTAPITTRTSQSPSDDMQSDGRRRYREPREVWTCQWTCQRPWAGDGHGARLALRQGSGRIAQRESARFTRERSLVRSQVRPCSTRTSPARTSHPAGNGVARGGAECDLTRLLFRSADRRSAAARRRPRSVTTPLSVRCCAGRGGR
jgi:hypothetical protein